MHLLIMRLLIAVIGVAFVSLLAPAFAEMNIDVVVDGLNNPWEMEPIPNHHINTKMASLSKHPMTQSSISPKSPHQE